MRDRPNDQHTKNLPVGPDEIRHHANEDKTDNSPTNLQVMKRADHTALHNRTRVLGRLRKALSMPARKEKIY
jgi:HNH endonuclease